MNESPTSAAIIYAASMAAFQRWEDDGGQMHRTSDLSRKVAVQGIAPISSAGGDCVEIFLGSSMGESDRGGGGLPPFFLTRT